VVEEGDPIDRGVEEEEPDGVEGLQSKVVVERRRSGEEVVRHFREGREEEGSRRSGTARRLRTSRPRIKQPKKEIELLPWSADSLLARAPPPVHQTRPRYPDVPLPRPRWKTPSGEVLGMAEAMEFQLFVSVCRQTPGLDNHAGGRSV
jgi:hypothetical protein